MDYIIYGDLKIRDMEKEDAKIIYNTYLSYNWHPVLEPEEGPYGGQKIPEIVDLCVFFDKHNLGIWSRLLDVCESEAAKICDKVYLGAGLHSGYGTAQRMYVKRGYIPDGSGVWWNGKNLPQYAECVNDDELVLYMLKEL